MMRNIAWQRLRDQALLLPLIALLLALAVIDTAFADAEDRGKGRGTVLDDFIDMTCFPTLPPGPTEPIVLDQPPPCDFPAGFTPYSSAKPSGRAHLIVKKDDTVQLDIKLKGITPGQTVTAWLIWYFQFRYPVDEAGNPLPGLFLSLDKDKDVVDAVGNNWVPFAPAAHSVPLAPTYAGYTEGLGREPNQIVIDQAGNGRLKVKLDYNPLKPNQGPLRNGLASTHQGDVPADSPDKSVASAAQPPCCSGLTRSGDPVRQAVGSSFLREFDPTTGFQMLDADGQPKLVRSPLPAVFISIISSVDGYTKGIYPGLPRVFVPVEPPIEILGDHIILGVFDLRDFHMTEE